MDETRRARTIKVDKQLTKEMPESFDYEIREPTFKQFILWLNNNFGDEC